MTRLNYDDGYDAVAATNLTHTYTESGVYQASFSVLNVGNGNISITCSETITVADSLCGNGVPNTGESCGEPGLNCG